MCIVVDGVCKMRVASPRLRRQCEPIFDGHAGRGHVATSALYCCCLCCAAAAAAMTTKILVAGDVKGSIDQLFARVGFTRLKGPFDYLLCVGDFFPAAADAAGAPHTIQKWHAIAAAAHIHPRSGSAGLAGTRRRRQGRARARPLFPDGCRHRDAACPPRRLRVGTLLLAGRSGRRPPRPRIRGRICRVRPAAHPRVAARLSPAASAEGGLPPDLLPERDLPTVGAELVAELAATVRPRYHFCGTEDAFFQRAPYRAASRTRPPPTYRLRPQPSRG